MEDIIKHIVNKGEVTRLFNNIEYSALLEAVILHDIPHDLLICLLNSLGFVNCLKNDRLDNDKMHDLNREVFDKCSPTEIRKYLKKLSFYSLTNHLEDFITFINSIWIDDGDYKAINIIKTCKQMFLKCDYAHISPVLRSLALIGIYHKNIEELLDEEYENITLIDSLYYNQRNRKIKTIIADIFKKMEMDNLRFDYNECSIINNVILMKLMIKMVNKLDIEHGRYYTSSHGIVPAICYQCNIINDLESIQKHIIGIQHTNIFDIIEYQHRKVFDKISFALPNGVIIRKGIIIYKLLIKLLQMFTTKNMTKLLLYFV